MDGGHVQIGEKAPEFVSTLKALKTLTLGKNKLKKMPDKELQGESAFDTTWMLTPREITPRVDLSKYPESRIYYHSSDDEASLDPPKKGAPPSGAASPMSPLRCG